MKDVNDNHPSFVDLPYRADLPEVRLHPSKHQTLNIWWFNVSPTSETWSNIKPSLGHYIMTCGCSSAGFNPLNDNFAYHLFLFLLTCLDLIFQRWDVGLDLSSIIKIEKYIIWQMSISLTWTCVSRQRNTGPSECKLNSVTWLTWKYWFRIGISKIVVVYFIFYFKNNI